MKAYKKLWAEVIDLSESTDEALSFNTLSSGMGQAAAIMPNMALGAIGGLNKSRFTKVIYS